MTMQHALIGLLLAVGSVGIYSSDIFVTTKHMIGLIHDCRWMKLFVQHVQKVGVIKTFVQKMSVPK